MASQSLSLPEEIERHIVPSDFARACLAKTRDDFVAEYGDAPLLLIQLDELDDELATGLLATSTIAGERIKPARDALGFSTIAQEATLRAKVSDLPPPAHFDPTQLETRLVRKPHFVTPLRRRPESAFDERISVGRAHNSDIVLRHASVSKFHAYFQCDETGQFYLADAKSKNGTRVNNLRVSGHDAAVVSSGDEIRFGKVRGLVVGPDIFWDAVAGASSR